VRQTSPRQAAGIAGAVLGLVYLATLAPGITLWDAGEFASAVESLGIPHPPGTPLFIVSARAWRVLLGFFPTALATNLLAAVCTALAAAIAAALVTRWTRDTVSGVAAALALGGMSTVWLNATETEVYSASLLMSVLMLYAGFRAGGKGGSRDAGERRKFVRLLAYLFALTPPLHLSAMVAAPAAVSLASVDDDLKLDGYTAGLLAAAAILAVGVGTGALGIAVAGIVAIAMLAAVSHRRSDQLREIGMTVWVVLVASTALLFLLFRARHDPAINQGDPDTLAGVVDVISRRQYDVPGLWPRRAPFWLQLGNLFQYVDWQFALGLDRTVGASPVRTLFTPIFLALAVFGSSAHKRVDRAGWAAMVILVASATLGIIVYLNLRAGPSYGYGVLPADADREPRERDYFFALGFAAVGIWIGIGAVAAARRLGQHLKRRRLGWIGVAIAALPIVLNWHATDRRREPGASLPNVFARSTLESAPPNAVLFVAGDNDTYPLWYAQVAEGVRRDVTVVTVPLLGATWYRAELGRRHDLYELADTAGWKGTKREIAGIALRARRAGRPVAAAVALDEPTREAMGDHWWFRGLVYVRAPTGQSGAATFIDVPRVDSTAAMVAARLPGRIDPAWLDDPASRYIASLMSCPALAAKATRGTPADSADLLASRCNFR
jgi:hypothetical protein